MLVILEDGIVFRTGWTFVGQRHSELVCALKLQSWARDRFCGRVDCRISDSQAGQSKASDGFTVLGEMHHDVIEEGVDLVRAVRQNFVG